MTQSLPESIQNYLEHGLSPHGWMDPIVKGPALALHVLEYKPQVAIEIGVYSGRSLIAIALAMEENKSGIVFGIDPWTVDASKAGFEDGNPNNTWWSKLDHSLIMNECLAGITKHQVSNRVQIIRKTSQEAFETGLFLQDEIELAHIDGNHSVESAKYDIEHWIPLVKPGGFVWMDDQSWDTTKPAQEKLKEFCDFCYMVGDCGVFVKR